MGHRISIGTLVRIGTRQARIVKCVGGTDYIVQELGTNRRWVIDVKKTAHDVIIESSDQTPSTDDENIPDGSTLHAYSHPKELMPWIGWVGDDATNDCIGFVRLDDGAQMYCPLTDFICPPPSGDPDVTALTKNEWAHYLSNMVREGWRVEKFPDAEQGNRWIGRVFDADDALLGYCVDVSPIAYIPAFDTLGHTLDNDALGALYDFPLERPVCWEADHAAPAHNEGEQDAYQTFVDQLDHDVECVPFSQPDGRWIGRVHDTEKLDSRDNPMVVGYVLDVSPSHPENPTYVMHDVECLSLDAYPFELEKPECWNDDNGTDEATTETGSADGEGSGEGNTDAETGDDS